MSQSPGAGLASIASVTGLNSRIAGWAFAAPTAAATTNAATDRTIATCMLTPRNKSALAPPAR